MMTLAEFLLARIAEDEMLASIVPAMRFADGVETHSPARVAADCRAKRLLVDYHSLVHDGCPGSATMVSDEGEQRGTYGGPCLVLRVLGEIYSDHPDYRSEWAW